MTEKGYKSIIGREDIVSRLNTAEKNGKAAHAYIFSGEKGIGKNYISKIFAMSLMCEGDGEKPCMECKSCKMALSGNHPDIIHITHEKPSSVGVDDIRKQLVEDVDIRPYCSKKKIYIVPDASKMTVQAQNALLKTLEEPPEYVHIFLLADNTDELLPTIASRCVNVEIKPVSDDKIISYLAEQYAVSEREAKLIAVFAQGNIGRACKLAAGGDFYEKLNESLRYLRNSKDVDAASRIAFGKKLAADKQGIFEYLEIFNLWFRDVLYFKASNDPDGLVFQDEIKYIRKRASVSSYDGIMTIINSVSTASDRLKANVNAELVLELLLMTVSEN